MAERGAGQGAGAGGARPGPGGRRPSQQPPRQHSNGGSRPPAGPKGGRSNSSQNQKTDDGFEVAKGSRRDREPAAPVKKDAPIRQGFSFAAAAGLVDDAPSTEREESGEKDSEGAEDVTKQLSEVKV